MNISRAYVELRMIARVYTQGKLQLSCQPSDSKTIYSTDVLIRCQFPPNKKTNHSFFIKKKQITRYTAAGTYSQVPTQVATKMLDLVQFIKFMHVSSSTY